MADKGKIPLPPALIELQELRFRGIPSIYDKLSSMKKMDKSLKEYTTGKLPQLRENIKKLSDETRNNYEKNKNEKMPSQIYNLIKEDLENKFLKRKIEFYDFCIETWNKLWLGK